MARRNIACSSAIFNEKGQILLGLKKKYDRWEFPGGKLEGFETLEDCVIREIKEETGIIIKSPILFAHSDYFPTWLSFSYRSFVVDAEPTLLEPDKHEMWQWFYREELPLINLTQCTSYWIWRGILGPTTSNYSV